MKTTIILTFFIIIISANCSADIIVNIQGDRFACNILDKEFRLQTSYAVLNIQKTFLKTITYKEEDGLYLIQSVNNDFFKGFLLNGNIAVDRLYDNKFNIGKMKIRQILFSIVSGTKEKKTALFFMKNNDKFSGRLLHDSFEVRTKHGNLDIPLDSVNRIVFSVPGDNPAGLTLKNGSLIKGEIDKKVFKIDPDSLHILNIETDKIHKIQFNAHKHISKRFNCPDTALPDKDKDGVSDLQDQCPETHHKASVDENGCWAVNDILFDFNKFDIKPEYLPVLNKIIEVLKLNPGLRIEIGGHSDNLGKEKYNQRLSLKRSKTVKIFLIKNGIDKNRLGVKGFGFAKPKAANENKSGRALNRRVEIIISP